MIYLRSMSRYIKKSHNVSVLMYHLVCPAKYRKVIFSEKADELLRDICVEIEKRFEIYFIEIGTDKDHVHFFVQSVPRYSPKKIVQTIKSITAREMFEKMPEIKEKLWGGEFWSKGYFISTVGKYGSEVSVARYVKNQGKLMDGYKVMYKMRQLNLLDQSPII
jgi:putative transposase